VGYVVGEVLAAPAPTPVPTHILEVGVQLNTAP
jgi:hypothetical protein